MDKSPIPSQIVFFIILVLLTMACRTECEQKPLCALNIGEESEPIYILMDTSLLPRPYIKIRALPFHLHYIYDNCVKLQLSSEAEEVLYSLFIFKSYKTDSTRIKEYEEFHKSEFEKKYKYYSKQLNPNWAEEYPYKYMDSIAGGLFVYSFDPKEGYTDWCITMDYQKRVSLNQSLGLELMVHSSSFKQQDSLNFIRFLETIEFLEPGDTNICKCFDDGVF